MVKAGKSTHWSADLITTCATFLLGEKKSLANELKAKEKTWLVVSSEFHYQQRTPQTTLCNPFASAFELTHSAHIAREQSCHDQSLAYLLAIVSPGLVSL